MKIQILDQVIMSFSFELLPEDSVKNDKTEDDKAGKIAISMTIPDKIKANENLSLIFNVELQSPTYSLSSKLAYQLENDGFTIKAIQKKEKEFLSALYPYAITTVKQLLLLSDVSNNLPFLPREI